MDLRLFGGLSLPAADGSRWRPRRLDCRRLLAHLALERGKRMDRAALAYRMWPDQPEAAAVDRLRRMLHELRVELKMRGLGEALPIYAERQRLGLEADGSLKIDTASFRNACEDLELLGDAGVEVLRLLEEPLAQGASPLLPELIADDEWLALKARQLADAYLAAMALLRDRLAAADDLPGALRCAERLTVAAPLSERAAGEMMRLLHGAGRRADALAAFDRCAVAIAGAQGLRPAPWLLALRDAVARGATAREVDRLLPRPHDAPRIRPQGLPRPLSSFHGREAQLAWLDETLGVARMVSILGLGGMGKTRLAVEAAWRMAGHFPDGIWFLPLEEITMDEGVAVFLAQLMGLQAQAGVTPLEQLRQAIGHKRRLVVLDNCEHVVAGAAVLARGLLALCPHVSVIATSRVALEVADGQDLKLGPLPVPRGEERLTAEELMGHASMDLLLDRMRSLGREKPLTLPELRTAARICRGVEGVPLAVELAAARTVLLPLEDIERGIAARRFSLLRTPSNDMPERHQALWATIDWSYQLLDEWDRLLLERLAVFPRDFTVRGAMAVARDLWLDAGNGNRPPAEAVTAMVECIERLASSSLLNVGRPLAGEGAGTGESERDPATSDTDPAALIELAMTVLEEAGLYSRPEVGDRQETVADVIDGDSTLDRPEVPNASIVPPSPILADPANPLHEQRFWMYVSVREFALLNLRDSGQLEHVTERCIDHYVSIATDAEDGFTGPSQTYWLTQLHAEYGNFRGVMIWLEERRDWECSLVIGLGLNRFWYQTDRLDYELGWTERLLNERLGRAANGRLDVVKMWHGYAIMLYGAGRLTEARLVLESCRRVDGYGANGLTNTRLILHLAILEQANGSLIKAYELCQLGLTQDVSSRSTGNGIGLLGHLTHRLYGPSAAIRILREALLTSTGAQGSIAGEVSIRDGLAYALAIAGEYDLSAEQAIRVVKASIEYGLLQWSVSGMLCIALICHRTGCNSHTRIALAAHRLARSGGSKALMSLASYYIGLNLLESTDIQRSRMFLLNSMTTAENLVDLQHMAYTACALLELAVSANDDALCEAMTNHLQNIPDRLRENRDLAGRVGRALAWYSFRAGDTSNALQSLDTAFSNFTVLENRHDLRLCQELATTLFANRDCGSHPRPSWDSNETLHLDNEIDASCDPPHPQPLADRRGG